MTLPKKNGDNQIEFRGLFNFVYSIYAISYFFISIWWNTSILNFYGWPKASLKKERRQKVKIHLMCHSA